MQTIDGCLDFKGGRKGKSFVLPYLDGCPFANSPPSPLLNQLSCINQAHPNPWSISFDLCLLGFEHLNYLSLRKLATRVCGRVRTLHNCFANNALLKQAKSWKPNPPFGFEAPIFQLIQWIFLLCSIEPHQNRSKSIDNSVHKAFGNL